MRMLKGLIFVLYFLSFSTCFSQSNFTISGTVTDSRNGEQLVGATIVVKGTSQGVITNVYGFYSLTLPAETYIINVSYVGYQLFETTLNLVGNIKLDVELTENAEELESVIVKSTQSKAKTTEIALGQLTTQYIKDIPAIFGEADLQQAMISLPGITSVSEMSNGFNVRGGKVDHNLILVDEAPVYNSTHLFGLVSVINPDAVKKVNVYKAGIPAKFGGRASSVIDIQLNSGNNKNFEMSGGISPLSSRLGISVPIVKDKLNIYASARASWIHLILKAADPHGESPTVSFADLTSKITYNYNSNNTIYVSGYFGRDKLIKIESSSTGKEKKKDVTKFQWGNATATIRWNHVFSPKWFSNLTLLRGQYQFSFNSNSDDFLSTQQGQGGSYINGVNNNALKYDINHYMSEKIGIDFGVGVEQSQFKIGGLQNARIKNDKYNINYFGYVDLEYKPINKLSSRIGLRYSGVWVYGPEIIFNYDPEIPPTPQTIMSVKRIKANGTVANYHNFEPRISANYEINNNSSIKIAYDRMAQYSHLLTNSKSSLPFESWTTVNQSFKPTITDQYSIGAVYDFSFLEIEGGLFYKRMNNLLQFKSNADLFLDDFIETKVLPTQGDSKGFELSLSKNDGRFRGFLNYTFSQTRVRTFSKFDLTQINKGNWFYADHDRPHVISLNFTGDISKRIKLTAQWNFSSGIPYTAATGVIKTVLTYSEKNAYRLPPTHRLDLAMSIYPRVKEKKKRWNGYWTISIINVYNRKNVYSVFPAKNFQDSDPNPNTPLPYSVKQAFIFGFIIPSFTYNFKFN